MALHRWSSLPRTYDLRLGHNRAILLLSLVGAAVALFAGVRGGLSPGALPARAVAGGLTVFATAALAKEIDPDHVGSALAGAALSVPAVWWVARPESLLPLLWLVLILRLINRSTGLAARPTDALAVLLLSAWLSSTHSPLFGLLCGMALILDASLPHGRRVYAGLGAFAFLVAALFWGLNAGRFPATPPQTWLIVTLLLITMATIGVILSCYTIFARGDATRLPLDPSRVQAGQILALAVGLFFASWHGLEGATLFAALWAALGGTVVLYWSDTHSRQSAAPL